MRKDLLWGGSIVARQCEGVWQGGGKGTVIMDLVTSGSHEAPREICTEIEEGKYYPPHRGIDFYHRCREDTGLFAQVGFKTLWISVDWSRIYPIGDEKQPNEEGTRYYRSVVDGLRAQGIGPMVTLYHFEMPYHLVTEYGSWTNRKVIDFYLKYCEAMFRALKGKVRYWVTFNEMNHIDPATEAPDIFTYIIAGPKFSQMEEPARTLAAMGYNAIAAGAKAVELGHRVDPDNQIGCVLGLQPVYAYNCKPKNVFQALKETYRDFYQMDATCNGYFPRYKLKEYEKMGIVSEGVEEDEEALKQDVIDFIGVNYYSSNVGYHDGGEGEEIPFGGVQNPYLEQSRWEQSIDPKGLRYLLSAVYKKYGKPLIVTENGLGAVDILGEDRTVDGSYRIEYLRFYLEQLKLAVEEDDVECFGYFMWGPIDLASATIGETKKRYDFIYVDQEDGGSGTGERYEKKSFDRFRHMIEANGEELRQE